MMTDEFTQSCPDWEPSLVLLNLRRNLSKPDPSLLSAFRGKASQMINQFCPAIRVCASVID